MINLIGVKAIDKHKGYCARINKVIENGLKFDSNVNILIGIQGVNKSQQEFYKENTICIDNGTYGD